MVLNCGIVGLPNVGKSTLFNVLNKKQIAESANYPFCTIEPNVGKVSICDQRLDKLAAIEKSAQIIYNQLEFVDIAGLVRGASQGEGLGNKFLSHIRQVDAIVHVVRCFDDSNIVHVNDVVDPIGDVTTIETELKLADLESIVKMQRKLEKQARSNDKEAKARLELLNSISNALDNDKEIKDIEDIDQEDLTDLDLLSIKPVVYVCNIADTDIGVDNIYVKRMKEKFKNVVTVSAKIEEELSSMDDAERGNFLKELGLETSGLDILSKMAYSMLGLETFFTVGPKEARAWTMKKGIFAPQAAGVIHTDFERGFIKASVMSYDDFIQHSGEVGCREVGKLKLEGKEYVMKDGDVVHFQFNV